MRKDTINSTYQQNANDRVCITHEQRGAHAAAKNNLNH